MTGFAGGNSNLRYSLGTSTGRTMGRTAGASKRTMGTVNALLFINLPGYHVPSRVEPARVVAATIGRRSS